MTSAVRGASARFAAGSSLLACATVLLAACTGSSGSSAASGPQIGSASASTSGSIPGIPASTPTRGTGPTAAVAGAWSGTGALCPDLQVKLEPAQGTSKVTRQVIKFVNRGPVACAMSGYPGVNLAGGTPPAAIGLAAAHARARAATVTLQPGGAGHALLQITHVPTYAPASCGPVQTQYLIVYRPDHAAPVELPYATTACFKRVQMLQISAISPGTGG
jgi:hypothetical protein